MKIKEKELARTLRKEGKTINEIIQETGFSKASISLWVRDIHLTTDHKQRITQKGKSLEVIERNRASRLNNEKTKRNIIIEKAKDTIKQISSNDLKIIGTILYLGEGGKTEKGMTRIANSDPEVIKIMMKYFREICLVPEDKFRCHIHTFDNADVEATESYWSKITKIPRDQFYKTYVKQSKASLKKRKTLPYGTCDICICDTKLLLTIIGWIEKIKDLVINDCKTFKTT